MLFFAFRKKYVKTKETVKYEKLQLNRGRQLENQDINWQNVAFHLIQVMKQLVDVCG